MTEQEIIHQVGELAERYYQDDQFSCAEAVIRAFAEVFAPGRHDLELVTRMATPFNGGFSELNSVCGAFTGGLMAIGMVAGRDQPGDEDAKEEAYTLTQIFHKRFLEAVGTDNCRQLLDRWSDQGAGKARCKAHTRAMSELLARTILQVGFHDLEVDEEQEEAA